MFCIACGRQMSDEDKFCSQCGTRRAIIPTDADAASVPASPARSEQPPSVSPPATVRPIRSTAEIMPIRVQRSAAPPPPAPDDLAAAEEEPASSQSVVPWPAEESASQSLFSESATPAPTAYESASPKAVEEPVAVSYTSVPFAAAAGSAEVSARRGRISPVLIGAVIVALLAVGGIVWMLRSSMSFGAKSAAKVEITIFPTAAKVAEGKTVDFAATVMGAPASEVNWTMEEGDDAGKIQTRGAYAKEGAISLYCTYTAPKKSGTYHLIATSTADTTKSASAEITVVR